MAHKSRRLDVMFRVKVANRELHPFFLDYFAQAKGLHLFRLTQIAPLGLVC